MNKSCEVVTNPAGESWQNFTAIVHGD